FDQNDQQPVPDTLPIEEDLPTEQEALQSISIQSYKTEDTDDTQDP
ncbi:9566_t:CDS:1, partial [Racocetra persica]